MKLTLRVGTARAPFPAQVVVSGEAGHIDLAEGMSVKADAIRICQRGESSNLPFWYEDRVPAVRVSLMSLPVVSC